MALPELRIKGTTFVLTGRMWKERRLIESDILRMGGAVAPAMAPGRVLVMASALLVRDSETGKWSTRGKATIKAETAMKTGALVYHEQMLHDALSGGGIARVARASSLKADVEVQPPITAIPKPVPEWDDEMQAKLDRNLRETREPLDSF